MFSTRIIFIMPRSCFGKWLAHLDTVWGSSPTRVGVGRMRLLLTRGKKSYAWVFAEADAVSSQNHHWEKPRANQCLPVGRQGRNKRWTRWIIEISGLNLLPQLSKDFLNTSRFQRSTIPQNMRTNLANPLLGLYKTLRVSTHSKIVYDSRNEYPNSHQWVG